MTTTRIEFIFSQEGLSREQVREKVVEKFCKEKPGPAKDGGPHPGKGGGHLPHALGAAGSRPQALAHAQEMSGLLLHPLPNRQAVPSNGYAEPVDRSVLRPLFCGGRSQYFGALNE